MPFATSLLRTHIGRRPGIAWSLPGVLLPQCQPEIRHERFTALVKKNIPRLDIPMDQPLLVGVMQCFRHSRHQVHNGMQIQPGLLES